ncbi:MAG: hypothetical protein ACOX8T_05050, partial [Bacillota bacterium]
PLGAMHLPIVSPYKTFLYFALPFCLSCLPKNISSIEYSIYPIWASIPCGPFSGQSSGISSTGLTHVNFLINIVNSAIQSMV